MILDSSALLAILLNEEDGSKMSGALNESKEVVRMSAASYLETSILIDKYRDVVLSARLDEALLDSQIVIEPVTVEQARIAREAYRNYGKGSGHRANLSFGDCFSYALARVKREPVLYKGDDFGHTDLRSALEEP